MSVRQSVPKNNNKSIKQNYSKKRIREVVSYKKKISSEQSIHNLLANHANKKKDKKLTSKL